MTTVAITNHKGGVGKTATTLHLGGALAHLGYPVLLWDLDPMGGLTTLLQQPDGPNPFTDGLALLDTPMDRVWLIPGGPSLKRAEVWLAHRPHTVLRDLLESLAPEVAFVLIDCPPQLDDFTKNALVAADAAILPVSCDTQDLLSFHKLLLTAEELSAKYPVAPAQIALLTKYHGESYDEEFRETLREAAPLLFERPIRYSTAFRQAGLYGASIFSYEPEESPARTDYLAVAQDLLELFEAQGSTFEVRSPSSVCPSETGSRESPSPRPSPGPGPLPSGHSPAPLPEGEGPDPSDGMLSSPLPILGEEPGVRATDPTSPLVEHRSEEPRANPKSKIQNPKSEEVGDVAA